MEIPVESAVQLSDPDKRLHLRLHWPVDVLQYMIGPMWRKLLGHFPKLLCRRRSVADADDVY